MAVISCYYPTSIEMKDNKWIKRFDEIGFGNQARIVGAKRVELKDFISSLLKEQRQEMVEEVEKLDCIDFGEQASHPNWIGRTSVLSILKRKKKL